MFLRLCHVFAPLALTALVALPASAQKTVAEKRDWIEAKSSHFQFYSDGRAATAQVVASDMETLRAVLSQLIPGIQNGTLQLQSPLPTSVYIFKDDASFEPFSMNRKVVGFFYQHYEGSYLAILNDSKDARHTTYHEYIHSFLHLNFPGIPRWLDEGMAEFYSSLEVKKDEVRLGSALEGRFADLLVLNLVPLPELMASQEFLHANDSSPEGFRSYATSWITAHYLLVGNPQRRRHLSIFLELLRRGAPADQAFPLAFQCTPEMLDQEVQGYFKNIRARKAIGIWRFDTKDLHVDPTFTAQPLPKDQALARLGMLDRRSMDKSFHHASRLYSDALALNGACALAWFGRGLASMDEGKFSEARDPMLKAAGLDPENYVAQFLASQLILQGSGFQEAGQRAQAAQLLLRGLSKAPGNVDALSQLLRLCEVDGTHLEEVTPLVESAIPQFPARRDLPLNFTQTLIRRRKFPEARRILEVLSAQGLDETSQRSVEGLQDGLRDGVAMEHLEAAVKLLEQGATTEGIQRLEAARELPASPNIKAAIQARLDQERADLEAAKAPAPPKPTKAAKKRQTR